MLRQKRYRVLALILACLAVLGLTSCSLLPDPSSKPSQVKIDDLMKKQENQNGAYQTINVLPSIKGIPSAASGKLLLTQENIVAGENESIVYRMYNLDLGSHLLTITDSRTVGFVSQKLKNGSTAEGIYYVLSENAMYIYNSDGSEAIAVNYEEETESAFADSMNGFSFNGTEYYVRDGFVLYEGEKPLESDYFNASEPYLGRYYYVKENEAVFVFDEQGKPIYEFHRPSYSEDCRIFVLGNGNVFIQYTYETIAGEPYDYIRKGKEHKIVSILANLERNTVTEPVVAYLVNRIENAFTDHDFTDRYTDRVTNVAQIIDITNGRIDENAPARYIVLSDSLIELFSMRDVVQGALDIIRISYDRNLVKTASGGLLVAGDCTVIGQLNNYRCITEKFIITSGKIYNHDLEPLFDLVAEGYTYRASVGDNIILSKIINDIPSLYLFTGEEPVYISAYSDYTACFEGYAVKVGESYQYFDENGNLLISTKEKIEWIDYAVEEEGKSYHVGYSTSDSGVVSYYQLSFRMISTLE